MGNGVCVPRPALGQQEAVVRTRVIEVVSKVERVRMVH